jgi:hypothetical protein
MSKIQIYSTCGQSINILYRVLKNPAQREDVLKVKLLNATFDVEQVDVKKSLGKLLEQLMYNWLKHDSEQAVEVEVSEFPKENPNGITIEFKEKNISSSTKPLKFNSKIYIPFEHYKEVSTADLRDSLLAPGKPGELLALKELLGYQNTVGWDMALSSQECTYLLYNILNHPSAAYKPPYLDTPDMVLIDSGKLNPKVLDELLKLTTQLENNSPQDIGTIASFRLNKDDITLEFVKIDQDKGDAYSSSPKKKLHPGGYVDFKHTIHFPLGLYADYGVNYFEEFCDKLVPWHTSPSNLGALRLFLEGKPVPTIAPQESITLPEYLLQKQNDGKTEVKVKVTGNSDWLADQFYDSDDE